MKPLYELWYANWEQMSEAQYKLLQEAEYAYLWHRLNRLQDALIVSVKLHCERDGKIDQTTEEGRNKYERRLDFSRKRRDSLVEERRRFPRRFHPYRKVRY